MKRIEEIRIKRQNQFILNRLKKGKELRKEADVKEVETNIHLIKAPTGRVKTLEKKMVQVIQEEDDDDMEEV